MKLSIVLVYRNAHLSIIQAINSLIAACKHVDYELIIVHDALTGSLRETVETNFPNLQIIAGDTNNGIAKTNNQAIRKCNGEYILLVNTDTICGRDSFDKMCSFMDEHPDTGGLGVRMLGPQGRFLPESIHGLTTQWAAFLKLTGFAKYLSKTRLYDRHRKDWVEEFQITEIDILNSDFMMLRRSVLNETGLFDERFFMFGHNIDLSYRIRLAGFKNYYFPKTYIINFESDPLGKFSWNYIKYFYGAMLIFALKYLLKVPQIKVGIPQLFPPTYEVNQ